MRRIVVVLVLALSVLAQEPSAPVAQAVRAIANLKRQMRDPDSFVVEKVMTVTDKKGRETTCISYRSKNGLGGMNREDIWYTLNNKGLWHTEPYVCKATKYHEFVDITEEVQKQTP